MDVGFVTFWIALLFVLSGCGDRLSGATAAADRLRARFRRRTRKNPRSLRTL